MIPGSNLLNMALGVIGAQEVQWRRNTGVVTNSAGIDVASFAAPETVFGSFQAVPRSLYQFQGLDFTKNYAMFYASHDMKDVLRDRAGDRLTYGSVTYAVESATSWFLQDGWDGVLCVELTNA